MVRGQKKKTFTTRAPTGTGTRKTGNSRGKPTQPDENTPPEPRARPRPIPLRKKGAKVSEHAETALRADADTAAAHALVSLQTGNQAGPRSPVMNRYLRAAMNLPPDTNLGASEDEDGDEESEEDELQDDEEVDEEVDQLLDDFSDLGDADLTLPTDAEPTHTKFSEFKVPLEVPYRQASRDVDGITSKTSFSEVLVQIARRMDVSVTHLSAIGYIPSYKPKSSKPVPKLLEDESSWFKLLEDIQAYILSCKGKTGKGAIKPFSIVIVDTTAPLDENKSQKKKKSSASSSDPSPPALTSKESEQLTAFKKLEKRHLCQQHRKPCIIQLDGEHYQLTISDLTKWAHLMAENKALLDTPPDELKLTDAKVRQASVKKGFPQTPTPAPNEASPPQWMQQIMGMIMMGNLASTANRFNGNPPTTPAPYGLVAPPMTPQSPLASTSAQKRPCPPLDYPSMKTWLQSIENDNQRSKKAQGFAEFADHFITNGIEDLEDFLRLTSGDILKIVPNINIGIANRLLAFAQEDHSSLEQHKCVQVQYPGY